jgi:hypothetical protein
MWRIFHGRFEHQKELIDTLEQKLRLQGTPNQTLELPETSEALPRKPSTNRLRTIGVRVASAYQDGDDVFFESFEAGDVKVAVVNIVNTIQSVDLPVFDVKDVKAQLFFREVENGNDNHDVVRGAWFGTDSWLVTFKIGVPRLLVVAVKDSGGMVSALENDYVNPEFNDGDYYAPRLKRLLGDEYMVMVQLLSGNELVKQFNCRLRIRPHFDICFVKSSSRLLGRFASASMN